MPATVFAHFATLPARSSASALSPEIKKRVVAAVARAFALDTCDLDSPTRGGPQAALARQAAMYLTHVIFALNFAAAGRVFGRDRTTVAHACRVIENLRDDPQFDARMMALENTIAGGVQ